MHKTGITRFQRHFLKGQRFSNILPTSDPQKFPALQQFNTG